MSRGRATGLLAAALSALAVGYALRGRWAAPPSILLVTLDTFRADHVGAHGNREGLTPHLDALAVRGVLFEEALASVPLTLPSHSTILSGLEPPRHGVRNNGTHRFPGGLPTLATLLKARGYATGAFVGAYVLAGRFGLGRGFDRYDDAIAIREEGASVLDSDRPCGEVAGAAIAWIREQREPFLAWVHFYDPHAPYDPPPPYAERFAGRPYEGEIAYTDACFGQLLSAAEAQAPGRLLVAALADHGEGRGDHGERTHGFFVYQPTLRIPFIVAGPGVPKGQRRAGLARTVDVLPTVLQLLGVPAPPRLDGVALLAAAARREAYAETVMPQTLSWSPLYSLRLGALKYTEAPRPELYDLATDAGETRNLVDTRSQDAERLGKALRAFRGEDHPWATAASEDRETAERLRALGYVSGGPPPTSPGSGALKDPKDVLELYRLFEESLWAETRGDRQGALDRLRELVSREPDNLHFRRSLARVQIRDF